MSSCRPMHKTFCCILPVLIGIASIQTSTVNGIESKSVAVHLKDKNSTASLTNSCSLAQPQATTNITETKCHRYMYYHNGFCRNTLGARDRLVFASTDDQRRREYKLVTFTLVGRFEADNFPPISPRWLPFNCLKLINDIFCHVYFPRCDLTSSKPQPQPVCKEACREMKRQCGGAWARFQRAHKGYTWNAQHHLAGRAHSSVIMRCKGLPKRRGGDIPQCYYPRSLNGKYLKDSTTVNCYYGNGRSYRGNVNRTLSGATCQPWTSQCPHRHYQTPDAFPELINANNACRNPGGQAPRGPWCFTSNTDKRWEYCDVTKCKKES